MSYDVTKVPPIESLTQEQRNELERVIDARVELRLQSMAKPRTMSARAFEDSKARQRSQIRAHESERVLEPFMTASRLRRESNQFNSYAWQANRIRNGSDR